MFKILALDGGGIRGAFTASVLARIEDEEWVDGSILDYFDLTVGTSTGAILALGLGFEMRARDILGFYRSNAEKIFPERTWPQRLIESIFGASYDPAELRNSLERKFGDRMVDEIEHSLAVTSFEAISGKPIVFRIPDGDCKGLTAAQVALASSAAPTYFPAHVLHDGQGDRGLMLDGGIWANCPAMVGVVEAIAAKKRDIAVLSIGTTTVSHYVRPESVKNGSALVWVRLAPTLLMLAQKEGVLAQAKRLDMPNGFVRIDAFVNTELSELDDAKNVDELAIIGRAAADENLDKVREIFFNRKARRKDRGDDE